MSWYDITECYWTAKYLLVRIYSKSVVCLTLFSCLGCTNLYRRTWLCCIEPRPQPPSKQPTFPCMHLRTKTYHMTPSHSHTNMHISIILPAVHKNTCSPPVTHSDSVSLTVQSNSSFFYRLTIWFIAVCCVALWAQILAGRKEGATQLLPFIALFHFNNGAVILKWHPCAI